MGAVFQQWWEDWGNGAITSLQPDQIPATSYPRARNTELVSVGQGQAIVAKRRGCRLSNTVPVTGDTAILGQFDYHRVSGGSGTHQHLLWSANGQLDEKDLNGNLTAITTGLASNLYPSVVTANNRCYWVNGVDRKKFDGLTVANLGLARPATSEWGTPFDVTTGGTMPPGATYEIALTYGNSVHGTESSRSEEKAVTTATDASNTHQLVVNWTTPADSQVDKVFVYVRKTNPVLNTVFLRAAEFAASALTGLINTPDATINQLVLLAPGPSQNDPPPLGVRYLAFHEGRLFAADDYNVYYSSITAQGAQIEAFDTEAGYEPINPGDGQRITGLYVAHEMLLVFKESSVWSIFGSDPSTWEIRRIIADIGCISHRSILTAENTSFWWSAQGPVSWSGSGEPQLIGKILLAPTVDPTGVVYASPLLFHAAADVVNQRVLFAVPSSGQDRADSIIPFNYRLSRWEATSWDPVDPASLATVADANGRPWVFLGSHAGYLFRLSDGTNDGLPAGTTSRGTFVAAATSTLTITDATAAFGTLVERKVTVVDSTGMPVSTWRARITSNTGTVLTLATAVGQLTVGATYTYYVGGPDWQWDSKWEDFDDPFWRKRFEFLYLSLVEGDPDSSVYADLAFDYSEDASKVRSIQINTVTAGTGVWNSSQWNAATWGELQPSDLARERIARTGRAWRVRLRNHEPDASVILRKLGIRAERLTDKN